MATRVEDSKRVNPIVHEHECLHQALRELRQLLEERCPKKDVARALTEFVGHVKSHFVHEEENDGFFEGVVDQAPRLKERADALLDEHAVMTSKLEKMQQHLTAGDESDVWWSILDEKFESFWELYCCHERSENELLQEAFHDDIGAED
jgi:Hemerythrin HHE cation binding domain